MFCLLIVESRSPELVVAPDHKEDAHGFIAQDEHLLFERVPETFVQPLSDTRSFGGFEIVACNMHDSELPLRVWGRAPRVSRNAAATRNVRGHSQLCVVAFWGFVAAITQHGIGDVHELFLLETRHRYRGTTINGRTGTRRGRNDCSAEARCELVLRSDKLEPVEKSHELESAPKHTEYDRRLLHTYESITK